MPAHIDIVFDGPPGPEAGRFVEVEDASGRSISVGEWIDRGNGYWALRIPQGHSPYGRCPYCGEPGNSRERRPNGSDSCPNGHRYPSAEALP